MPAVSQIEIRLNAVIVAVTKEEPRLLIVDDETTGKHALPFGPFNPAGDPLKLGFIIGLPVPNSII